MCADRSLFDGVEARPGSSKPDPVLVVDEVSKSFGGLQAVDVAHLEIQRGSITALIGPNGAGKTTFFNQLTGFDQPDRGRWAFDGVALAGKPAHAVARAGMTRTFQLTKVLARMSVIDNMRLGELEQRGESFLRALVPPTWRSEQDEITVRADALLDRYGLTRVRDDYAATLSGGQRKLLEMARAEMCSPRLVMLDEPMAGVNPALVQSLLDHIRALRERGTTVVFVEHDMDVVMGISDWIVVLAEGSVIAEGTPDDIAANESVIDAYLGTAA